MAAKTPGDASIHPVGRSRNRALILARSEEEARAACTPLVDAGIPCDVATRIEGLPAEMERGVGVLLIYEPGFSLDDLVRLAGGIRARAGAMEVPLVRLVPSGGGAPASDLPGPLSFAVILPLPVPPFTLISIVQVARFAQERLSHIRDSETALRESETQYRSLFEIASIGISQADPEGRLIRANDRMCEIVGYPREELIGKSVRDLTHPEDRDVDWDLFQRMLRGETTEYENEKRYVRKDGAVIWARVTARGVRDPRGRLLRTVAIIQDITEARRTSQALAESERRYRELFRESLDSNVVMNVKRGPDGGAMEFRFADVNPAAERFLRRTRAELLGKTPVEAFGGSTAELHDLAETVVRTGRAEMREFPSQVLGRDLQAQAYVPVPGQVAVVLRDVTERRRADEVREKLVASLRAAIAEANRNRAQLEAVFESVDAGMVVMDMDGNCLLANEAELRIAGLAPGEKFPANIRAFGTVFELSELDGRRVEVERWPAFRVLRGETFSDWELRARRSDTGREAVLAYSGQPVRDEAGRQILALVINRDITDRKRAEESLRESEARFRTLADNIAQLAWMGDPAGTITWVNRRWVEFAGFGAAEADERRIRGALHPDEVERVMDTKRRAFGSGRPFESTFMVRGVDGRYRWFLERATPLRDPEGRVERWFGTLTDVTELRTVEDALRSANERLAEADRRKDEFLAILAHELRNPLAPIRNAVQVLQLEGSPEPALQRQREIIDRQIAHMARLLDDLLDVSRITRGLVDLRTGPVSMADVLARAVESARPLIEAREHRLETSVPSEPVCVLGDFDRLIQVVGNLLNNAARYTPPGGRIDLALAREDGEAVVRVRDDGEGIGAEVLPNVFEAFATRSPEGLGLGLALARSLVLLHGGRIEARSAGRGRGSEFTVRLPLWESARADAEDGAEPEGSAARRRKPLRVMIVDDMIDTADSLAHLLELLGYDTLPVYDGEAALEAMRTFRPDVVLLDIGMPGMDGYETARRIRADAEAAGIRIVAITGYGQEEDRRKSQAAGFDRHLTKPVEIGELRRTIDELHP